MARLPLYVDLSRDAPIWSRRGEPVAQPVEHLTFNQGVPGSNPGGLTISRHSPARFFRAPCLSSSRTFLRRGGSTNRSCWRRGQLFLVVKVLKPWIKASGLGIEGG